MPDVPLFPTDAEVERAWLYDTLGEILLHAEAYGQSVPNHGGIRDTLDRYSKGLPMNYGDED